MEQQSLAASAEGGGGGGSVMDDEKLAHFQSLTGVDDMATCARILERYGWDLDAAVSAAMDSASVQPSLDHLGAGERLGVASNSSSSTGRYSRPPHAAVGLAQLASNDTEMRGRLERRDWELPPPPPPSPHSNNPGALVWRLVTLPFSIVRGGLTVVSGAMGLGVWVAGSVLSYSLGALGLAAGEQATGARLADARDRLLPVGSVQAIEFVRNLEQEYGDYHPNFQATSFMEALRRAAEEFKFLFVYLHSPEHVHTPSFCQETLCSELVVQFLNHNFVAWGGDVRNTEGFQMFNSLKASTFPFCAVVMASSNQRIALLQQVEGPKSAQELVSILQRVLEEQGAALVASQAEEEERRRNRQLREEQDAAYQAALRADQERERQRLEEAERLAREAAEVERQRREREEAAERAAKEAVEREAALERLRKQKAMSLGIEPERGPDVTQVLVRFPNGERKEHRFKCTATVQTLYDYVDSLGCLGDAQYSLVSNFPRTVYSADKLGMCLKDVGLHPHASLFVQME